MTTNPEEHDFIQQVFAEDDSERAPKRLSDFRTVPLSMLAAACYAIQNKKDAPKLLAHIRRYTLGDLANPAFDEAAERVKFEAWANVEYGVGEDEELNLKQKDVKANLTGWLACARSRHNESTMQGEE